VRSGIAGTLSDGISRWQPSSSAAVSAVESRAVRRADTAICRLAHHRNRSNYGPNPRYRLIFQWSWAWSRFCLIHGMTLPRFARPSKMRRVGALRHNFVVGPLHPSALTGENSQLFFCARCRWRFLVSRAGVVVVANDGNAMKGADADSRFDSFENGPCPALEAMNREFSVVAAAPPPVQKRRSSVPRAALLPLIPQPRRSSSPRS
jgi:hypothetical protein